MALQGALASICDLSKLVKLEGIVLEFIANDAYAEQANPPKKHHRSGLLRALSFTVQDHGKGGLSLRGVAFMTVLAVLTVLGVLENTLPSFCLSYKIQHNEATVAVWTVLAVSAVMAVSVMTTTPLKLNPPFPSS